MFIFMQQFCVSLSAEKTVSKLKWGWKLQNFAGADPQIAAVYKRNHTCLPGPYFGEFFFM